jgi:hypothetical protein
MKLLLWDILIVPWLTLFALNRVSVKRYMPVALLASLMDTVWLELAQNLNWVKINVKLFPSLLVEPPLTFGAFLVGTIWIFHLTYRKFWLYLATNIVVDFLFSFPLSIFFERIGYYTLIQYTHGGLFFTAVSWSLVIYAYQLWQEGVLIKPLEEKNRKLEFDFKKLRRKEKAR